MAVLSQLRLLLYKDLLVQWRSKLWTVFELALPLAIIVLLGSLGLKYGSALDYPSDPNDNYPVIQFPIWQTVFFVAPPSSLDFFLNNKNNLTFFTNLTQLNNEIVMMEQLKNAYDKDPEFFNGPMGFIIDEYQSNPFKLRYRILLPENDRNWHLKDKWAPFWTTSSLSYEGEEKPDTDGLMQMQLAIDSIFINSLFNLTEQPEISTLSYPQPPNYTIGLSSLLLDFYGMLLGFVLLISVIHTSRAIATEKETKMKDYMAVMGMQTSIFHLSHYIFALLKMLFLLCIAAGLIAPTLHFVTAALLVLVFILYAFSTAAAGLLLSCIFTTAGGALRGAVIIWMAMVIVPILVNPNSLALQFISALNCNAAFNWALKTIGAYEYHYQHMAFTDLFVQPWPDNSFSIGFACLMLIFDTVWMWLLALYLDAVFPSGDALAEHPLFFLTCIRRSTKQNKKISDYYQNGTVLTGAVIESSETTNKSEQVADIEVDQLTKIWSSSPEPAVNCLTLKAYRGQITALLGHNGAGKSTTFAMLTGMTTPSRGSVKICGFDTTNNMQEIRQRLGFCPQYNALYDKLTVNEHLRFFSQLRGGDRQADAKHVQEMLNQLQMMDKANAFAETLSGGMKRKLALMIALAGNSEVVILDEPTAGMDPGARHATWNLLQRERVGRTMLLTTHYMEEADLLAERIAILAHGQLRCMGTSMFLKKHYGDGYTVTVVLNESASSNGDNIAALLEHELRKFSTGAHLKTSIGREVQLYLPAIDKPKFAALFGHLEQHQQALGIDTFGVSATTLEEVFIKVDAEVENKSEHENQLQNDVAKLFSVDSQPRITGGALILHHLLGIWWRRLIVVYRHKTLLIPRLFLPILVFVWYIFMLPNFGQTDNSYHGNRFTYFPSRYSPSKFLLRTFGENNALASALVGAVQRVDGLQEFTDYYMNKINRLGPIRAALDSPMGTEINNNGKQFTIWSSPFAIHARPAILSLINEARIDALSDYTQKSSIEASVQPIPSTSNSDGESFSNALKNIGLVVVVIPCMAMVYSGIAATVVSERAIGYKHMQLLLGLRKPVYWISMASFDIAMAMLIVVTFLAIMLIKGYREEVGPLALIWVLYYVNAIPHAYTWSFVFSNPSKAYALTILFTIVTSVLAILIYLIAETILDFLNMKAIPDIVGYILWVLFPSFNMGWAVTKIMALTSLSLNETLWSWSGNVGIIPHFACIVVSTLFSWLIIYLKESNIQFCCKRTVNSTREPPVITIRQLSNCFQSFIDVDVANETNRIASMDPSMTAVLVKDLRKHYGRLQAVAGVNFASSEEECFGLLGINGAGKTSIFKMLTGQETITGGKAFIKGISIGQNRSQAGRIIGYCPQFDAVLDELTGTELLNFAATLRGVRNRKEVVQAIIACIGIGKHANKRTAEYSGGNKRRLSIGQALIGSPSVVFLDEPTAGVDPAARQVIWRLLSEVRKQRTSLLLTTHRMEECEALCTRIGIIQQGRMIAIGSNQHMKSRFGQVFQLVLKFSESANQQLAERVRVVLPNAHLEEICMTQMSFTLSRTPHDTWSRLFAVVEQLANELKAIDYSLSQSTLEQTFLHITGANVPNTRFPVVQYR